MKTGCFEKCILEQGRGKWHEDGEICIEKNHIIVKIIWVRCSQYGKHENAEKIIGEIS